MDLGNQRREYRQGQLDDVTGTDDPMVLFTEWFASAGSAGVAEPNAMTLATVAEDGRPSARIVLLKGIDNGDFLFFTDYRSRKGRELDGNPNAALVFWWQEMERQVRVEGTIERLDPAQSAAYFKTRPHGSQIGAWASHQSEEIVGREGLEAKVIELEARFAHNDVPLPPHWGGFRLTPLSIEFWQGRSNRLHDRFVFTQTSEHGWRRARLSP